MTNNSLSPSGSTFAKMSNPTLLLFLSICFVSCDSLWGTTKNIESHLCPDKAGTCPDKSTCCKLNSGKYGCCPLPNAVCCSDHLHCCPSGFKCDAAQGTCSSSNLVIDWLLPIAKEPVPLEGDKPGAGLKQERDWRKDPENVECPGHRVECPSGDTCCKMGNSDYGCCPLPEAVCCKDQSHCCPKGTTCDDKAKTCKKQADQGSTLWMNLVLGRRRDDSKVSKSSKITSDNTPASGTRPTKASDTKPQQQGKSLRKDLAKKQTRGLDLEDGDDDDDDDLEEAFSQQSHRVLKERGKIMKQQETFRPKVKEIGKPKPVSKKAKENLNVKKDNNMEKVSETKKSGLDKQAKNRGGGCIGVEKGKPQQTKKARGDAGKMKGETKALAGNQLHKGTTATLKGGGIHKGKGVGIEKGKGAGHTSSSVKEATTSKKGEKLGIEKKKDLKVQSKVATEGGSKSTTKGVDQGKHKQVQQAGPGNNKPNVQTHKGGNKSAKQVDQGKTKPLKNKDNKMAAAVKTKPAATESKKSKTQVKSKPVPKQQVPPVIAKREPVQQAQKQFKISGSTTKLKQQQQSTGKTAQASGTAKASKSPDRVKKEVADLKSTAKPLKDNKKISDNVKVEAKIAAKDSPKVIAPSSVPVTKDNKNADKKKLNSKDIDLEAAPTGVRRLIYKLGMMTQKLKNILVSSLIDSEENELDHPVDKEEDHPVKQKSKKAKSPEQSGGHQKISKGSATTSKQNKREAVDSTKQKAQKTVIKRDTATKTVQGSGDKRKKSGQKGVSSSNVTVTGKVQTKAHATSAGQKGAQKSPSAKPILPKTSGGKDSPKVSDTTKSKTHDKKKESAQTLSKKGKAGTSSTTGNKKAQVPPKAQTSKLQQTKVPQPKADHLKTKATPSRVSKPVAKDVPAQKTTQSVGIKKNVKVPTEGIHGIPNANLKALKEQMLKQQQKQQAAQKLGKTVKQDGVVTQKKVKVAKTTATGGQKQQEVKPTKNQQGKVVGKVNNIPTKKARNM